VPLVNRSALAGSRYPVFLAVEYDDGPVHQTVIAESAVEILASKHLSSSQDLYLWLGAAVFGLLFAALVGYRVVKR
jgi:hypothetical protein